MKKLLIIIILTAGLSTSCTVVKPYQKVNLNDPDMSLSQRKDCKFVSTFQVYREASSGASGGKTGGGCGCN